MKKISIIICLLATIFFIHPIHAIQFKIIDLGTLVGTNRRAMAINESPNNNRMPSFEFLDRIAKAFNRRLVISLQR